MQQFSYFHFPRCSTVHTGLWTKSFSKYNKLPHPFPGIQHPLLLGILVPPPHVDHEVAQPGDGVVLLVPVAHLIH